MTVWHTLCRSHVHIRLQLLWIMAIGPPKTLPSGCHPPQLALEWRKLWAIPQIHDVLHQLSEHLPITHVAATVRNVVAAMVQWWQRKQPTRSITANPTYCINAHIHSWNQGDSNFVHNIRRIGGQTWTQFAANQHIHCNANAVFLGNKLHTPPNRPCKNKTQTRPGCYVVISFQRTLNTTSQNIGKWWTRNQHQTEDQHMEMNFGKFKWLRSFVHSVRHKNKWKCHGQQWYAPKTPRPTKRSGGNDMSYKRCPKCDTFIVQNGSKPTKTLPNWQQCKYWKSTTTSEAIMVNEGLVFAYSSCVQHDGHGRGKTCKHGIPCTPSWNRKTHGSIKGNIIESA